MGSGDDRQSQATRRSLDIADREIDGAGGGVRCDGDVRKGAEHWRIIDAADGQADGPLRAGTGGIGKGQPDIGGAHSVQGWSKLQQALGSAAGQHKSRRRIQLAIGTADGQLQGIRSGFDIADDDWDREGGVIFREIHATSRRSGAFNDHRGGVIHWRYGERKLAAGGASLWIPNLNCEIRGTRQIGCRLQYQRS